MFRQSRIVPTFAVDTSQLKHDYTSADVGDADKQLREKVWFVRTWAPDLERNALRDLQRVSRHGYQLSPRMEYVHVVGRMIVAHDNESKDCKFFRPATSTHSGPIACREKGSAITLSNGEEHRGGYRMIILPSRTLPTRRLRGCRRRSVVRTIAWGSKKQNMIFRRRKSGLLLRRSGRTCR